MRMTRPAPLGPNRPPSGGPIGAWRGKYSCQSSEAEIAPSPLVRRPQVRARKCARKQSSTLSAAAVPSAPASARSSHSPPHPPDTARALAHAHRNPPAPLVIARVAHFYVKGTGARHGCTPIRFSSPPGERNRMCGTSRNDTPPSTKTTNVGDSVGLGRCDVMPVAVARFLTCRPVISAKGAKELGRSAMKPAATHDGRLRGQGQKWDQRNGAGYVAWWTSCCRDTMAQETMARDTLGASAQGCAPHLLLGEAYCLGKVAAGPAR
jgi:hypothetical protein